MNNQNSNIKDIENLVIEHDKGARKLTGFLLSASLFIALFWSLFQIWVYSDFQLFFSKLYFWEKFNLNSDILYFNNNIAKRVHLLFALLLAFIFYPAFKQSSRNHIPIYDWIFILLTLISIGYVLVNYNEIAYRIGDFNDKDMFFSIIIVIISLEAVRRIVGIPLLIIAIIIFLYTVFGDLAILPEELQHKSYSIKKVITQITLTSEGIFGIALGVSSEFVFLFVLFGALLERSGAGNYFINVSFALLGHMKGGPAKAAIIASAATGSITGSSIANVVTTGTFTIPLMRKIGFSRDKSAALEVSSSVNGQIMPPVMGAAAFLIVEYVGITYSQLIQNALLPAILAYISLIYMVHLEAIKIGTINIDKKYRTPKKLKIMLMGISITSFIMILSGIYILLNILDQYFQYLHYYVVIAILVTIYVIALKISDNINIKNVHKLNIPTVKIIKSGLHFLIPILILMWCLIVEKMKPNLAVSFAILFIIFNMLTENIIREILNKTFNYKKFKYHIRYNFYNILDGLAEGARNMVGVAIATAVAGIVVGCINISSIGLTLVALFDYISQGSLFLLLLFSALLCIILGLGLPTTANYVVVATLVVSSISSISQQIGIDIPIIAIHLFVFYFGIMADVTPPVGLASYAGAAISGGSPIRTGIKAFYYNIRTMILPFIFIYNSELILYNINLFTLDGILYALLIIVISLIAIIVFTAGISGYFLTSNKKFESIILLIVAFFLFMPNLINNILYNPFKKVELNSISELQNISRGLEDGTNLKLHITGKTMYNRNKDFLLNIKYDYEQGLIKQLENELGILLSNNNNKIIIQNIIWGSKAAKMGLDDELSYMLRFDYVLTDIAIQQPQPNKRLVYIPAFILLLIVVFLQIKRKKTQSKVIII